MEQNPVSDIPEGLSMALAQNIYAMQYFSSLPDSGRREIIRQTRDIGSKAEMQRFVNSMVKH